MRQSLRLGRIAGIPVGANWTAAVIIVVIGWSLGASVLPAEEPGRSPAVYTAVAVVTALLFAASLLAHEMAHSLVAKRNDVRVRQITLWMLGGVSELDADPPNPGADLRIALAGPATSAALAGICVGTAAAVGYGGGPLLIDAALVWLGLMNGILAVFNMLPGAPLDGGRVLRAILWHHYRDQARAAIAAARAGQVTGAVVAVAGVADLFAAADTGGLWIAMIGVFLFGAAGTELRAAQVTAVLSSMRVRDVMAKDPVLAPAGLSLEVFAPVAARFPQGVFPVIDVTRALIGVMFADAPQCARPGTIAEAAEVLPPAYVVSPGDPAASLLRNPPLRRLLIAVVVDDGEVTGLVTVRELTAAVRRAGPLRVPASRGSHRSHNGLLRWQCMNLASMNATNRTQ